MTTTLVDPTVRGRITHAALTAATTASRPFNHRGIRELAWRLGCTDKAVATLSDGGRLAFRLNDSYWTHLLAPGSSPSLEPVFRRIIAEPDGWVIDAGANIGYWSVRAAAMMPHRVIAVEAAPETYRELVENAARNGNRFVVWHRAVWSDDDSTLEVVSHVRRHAGASVVNRRDKRDAAGYSAAPVRSVTLDALAGPIPEDAPVLVKLDVEGAEVAALAGAKRLLDRGALVAYEDHGSDPSCEVTRAVLDLGLEVWDVTGRRRLDVAGVAAVKVDPVRGYNFLAVAAGSRLHPSRWQQEQPMSSGRGGVDMRGHLWVIAAMKFLYIVAGSIWLWVTDREWRRRWRAHGRVRDVMWQPDQEQP